MNLEFTSSDEVGFWVEIEYNLDGGGKKHAKMKVLRSKYHPIFSGRSGAKRVKAG